MSIPLMAEACRHVFSWKVAKELLHSNESLLGPRRQQPTSQCHKKNNNILCCVPAPNDNTTWRTLVTCFHCQSPGFILQIFDRFFFSVFVPISIRLRTELLLIGFLLQPTIKCSFEILL
eukprot:Nitzschia sp. Nitz4//scaffold119_size111653//51538//52273//NITZ4_004191-RA/size111653-snap-gene-0.61-mRNA-1//1//CDS//3329533839//5443//frame0